MHSKDDFETIIRKHQAMVYSIAYNFFHNAVAAEDVAQDVFLQLYEHFREIQSPEHLTAWLRRATTHRAIDVLRRKSVQSELYLATLPELPEDGQRPDPFLERRLQRLVASLPEKQRAVVVLRYGEDLDPPDIADILGIPVATVRSHLQRAIALMREKAPGVLGEDIDESIRR
jgi:RNA polymerase sigma-70 factor (ECF subfamily)